MVMRPVYQQVFDEVWQCYRATWETDDDHAASVDSMKRACLGWEKLMEFADGKPHIFQIDYSEVYPCGEFDGTRLHLRVYEIAPTDDVVAEIRKQMASDLDDCCSG